MDSAVSATGKMLKDRVGFIGAGNMAQAIGIGLIKNGIVPASKIIVSAPSDTNSGPWKKLDVRTVRKNGEVLDESDIVFLAIKPQYLDEALKGAFETKTKTIGSKLYISILVGITIDVLEQKLEKFGDARVVRSMVNTPLLVGAGCSVFCCGHNVNPGVDEETVRTLFSSSGVCEMVPERLINPFGAMAGSGPAYIYMVIEALADGAVKQGIPRAMATSLAAQMVLGSAKMVLETGRHPGQLKDEVCSPGGSTIHGVHALERAGLRCAFIDAVEAAAKKSAEFSKQT